MFQFRFTYRSIYSLLSYFALVGIAAGIVGCSRKTAVAPVPVSASPQSAPTQVNSVRSEQLNNAPQVPDELKGQLQSGIKSGQISL